MAQMTSLGKNVKHLMTQTTRMQSLRPWLIAKKKKNILDLWTDAQLRTIPEPSLTFYWRFWETDIFKLQHNWYWKQFNSAGATLV